MDRKKLTYREFTMMIMLYDQTNIVTLLKNDKSINQDESIFNKYDVTICLPDGAITMPSTHYYDLLNENGAKTKALLLQKHALELENRDTTILQAELDQLKTFSLNYEEATFKDRFIFEWRLIPYWLADKLIYKGETVFRAFGCDWWGMRELRFTGTLHTEILKEVFNCIIS